MKLVLNTVQTIPAQVQNLFVDENILDSHVIHYNGFKSGICSYKYVAKFSSFRPSTHPAAGIPA
jgi:hypothetical protein